MGFIAAADPTSKQAFVFTNVGQLHDAIKMQGYIPIREDGTNFVIQEFEGGYLLDGAPLNVYIDGEWFEGQMELLMPLWESGRIPTPTASILGAGTVPMPETVKEAYQAYKEAETPFGLGVPAPILIGGALLGVWLLTRR